MNTFKLIINTQNDNDFVELHFEDLEELFKCAITPILQGWKVEILSNIEKSI